MSRETRAKALAAALIKVFKWETCYRRAVRFSRGTNENCQAWKVFAAYAQGQLDRATDEQREALASFRHSVLRRG